MGSIGAFLVWLVAFGACIFAAAWVTLLPAIGLLWCLGWMR